MIRNNLYFTFGLKMVGKRGDLCPKMSVFRNPRKNKGYGYRIFYLRPFGTLIPNFRSKNDPSYIKQFLQSRLGLKLLISHDLEYAKIIEA